MRHSLLTGLELARYADAFTLDVGLLPIVDIFDPVELPGSMPLPLPEAGFAGDAVSTVIAPYVIDQIELGEHVHVLAGGRLDNIDFSDDLNARERTDTEFSPMVGVLGAINDELSIYGNYSRSFAPPSARVFGELVPERGTQIEAGIKKRFGPWNAETTFAVYQLERDNIPIADDTGFTQQTGNQRSRGFEIDFAAQPSARSRAFVSYAYNDAELTEFREAVLVSIDPPLTAVLYHSGNDPAFAPKHIMNFWLSHDFGANWGVGGGGRYLGSQFHRGRQPVRARQRVDLRCDGLLPNRRGRASSQPEELDRSGILSTRLRRPLGHPGTAVLRVFSASTSRSERSACFALSAPLLSRPDDASPPTGCSAHPPRLRLRRLRVDVDVGRAAFRQHRHCNLPAERSLSSVARSAKC